MDSLQSVFLQFGHNALHGLEVVSLVCARQPPHWLKEEVKGRPLHQQQLGLGGVQLQSRLHGDPLTPGGQTADELVLGGEGGRGDGGRAGKGHLVFIAT